MKQSEIQVGYQSPRAGTINGFTRRSTILSPPGKDKIVLREERKLKKGKSCHVALKL